MLIPLTNFRELVMIVFTTYPRREKMDREMSVVLLADSTMLRLPLEAMTVLQTKNIHSVARDFSLQMLCHRIGKFTADESSKEGEKLGVLVQVFIHVLYLSSIQR